MTATAQDCARMVTALADLADQESAALRAGDYAAAAEIQGRCAPLLEFLSVHAESIRGRAELTGQLRQIRAQRNESSAQLEARIEAARTELGTLQSSRRRLNQIAPAYGHANAAPRRQLSAVG